MLISLTLILIYVLLAGIAGVTLWSLIHGLRLRGGSSRETGIPVRRLALGVSALLLVLLTVTALTASTAPLVINGKPYTNVFWLRVSDMLIFTSLALIILAALAVALGMMRIGRNSRNS